MRQTASRRNRFQARTTFLTVPPKKGTISEETAPLLTHIF